MIIGMMVHGSDEHAASAIIPGFNGWPARQCDPA
jgi:hypothetical protein